MQWNLVMYPWTDCFTVHAKEEKDVVHNCIKKQYEYYYGRVKQVDGEMHCLDKERYVHDVQFSFNV